MKERSLRHLTFATALALGTCLAAPLAAQDPTQETENAPMELTFERVFASPDLTGPAPRKVKLSPDGRYLTLLRNREDDRERYDLWAYDREASEWTMLVDSEALGTGRELSEDEKMQRERARVGSLKGIIDYQWTEDGSGVLVPLDGDLYLARLGGEVLRLTDTEESELNPALSSKGGYVSFVRDRQLWVGQVGGEAQPITPKEGEGIRWGEAEFVAQEEMARLTGYWWGPNDRRIAVQRFDESMVGIVTRAAIGATGTKVFDQRYPVAGSANAVVELFVMDPDGENRVKVDLGEETDIYLARVDWAPDGSALYVQRQNREQTVLDMLRVDPVTGESEVLFTERAAMDDYWINLGDDYKWLDDGSLIWWSERDGFGHLYRYAEGNWTQLTSGEWVVTKLVGIDQQAGRVFFQGTKDDVLAQQVYSLDLADPGAITRLTDTDYANSATMDAKGQTLVVTRSNDDTPPHSYIADQQGNRLAWIEENALDAGHPYAPFLASHRPTQYGTIPAEDGTPLYWEMVTPEMEPGKRYPVYYYHYSGPGPQVVNKGWNGALRQAIVDKGYIWFALDNRGSANRGVAFEQPLYRAMGGVEVRDQKTGAEFLKTLDFVDPDKIAIDGWSYGGYITLKQLQADPGLYAAGISGAPVTKWELYDTHYTERYMGTPQEDAEAYEKASAIPDAAKISDPLLIIHGMADDNVVFENATEVISAMQEANVPFEMMLYPGYTHRVSGEQISPHRYNTVFRFLDAHGVTPPE
ncbi:MAG: DPP IV N-terminal domain-containing protein [Erythrobacter sp.]|uniref:S9 family peptidase n=1 Tax=Erythrobacter sp. TaxID=1042 RepID=UPI001B06D8CA|nr:S9 family peptidase [Erythrobacter sp.]MBO6526281.1 DPP IV N-terminal domain-containing protein [Erythrobacter sp.]MBO6530534.1 DPP IV N-terminal domain-containing protein [Erythrobacter sp.]